MIKAIIFDCFGVLITDALNGLINELSKTDPANAYHITELIDKSNKGQIETITARTAIASILGISPEEYTEKLRCGEIKNQELLDKIKDFRKQYKTGLLSNVGISGLEYRFQSGELEKYFDVIVPSGQIGFAKPEAQAYEITAERLGVRLDECVFIDDREEYCRGAQGVGMKAIKYQTNDQLYKELAVLNVTVN